MEIKARVILKLINHHGVYCCSKCGDRTVSLRVIETLIQKGFTEVKSFCIPCSVDLLQRSIGDPRE